MNSFREDIKDPYIIALDIIPIDYDEKRGVNRLKLSNNRYIYDEADKIIIRTFYKHMGNKRQLHRTFSALYHCYTLAQTVKYLSDSSHNDVNDALKIDTVRTYIKRVKDGLKKAIDSDDSLKINILDAIKEEYERRIDK